MLSRDLSAPQWRHAVRLLCPDEEHVKRAAGPQLTILNDHRRPLVTVPIAVLIVTTTRNVGRLDSCDAGIGQRR
jgi:hypothetical protein